MTKPYKHRDSHEVESLSIDGISNIFAGFVTPSAYFENASTPPPNLTVYFQRDLAFDTRLLVSGGWSTIGSTMNNKIQPLDTLTIPANKSHLVVDSLEIPLTASIDILGKLEVT